MKKATILLTFLIFLGFDCRSDKTPTAPPSNPFAGTWSFVFAGTYVGSGNTTIDSEGQFAFSVLLTGQSGSFTNTISGSVTSSGSLSGDILYSGQKIGTISGTLTGNAGSGSYQTTAPSSGTWSATRM